MKKKLKTPPLDLWDYKGKEKLFKFVAMRGKVEFAHKLGKMKCIMEKRGKAGICWVSEYASAQAQNHNGCKL